MLRDPSKKRLATLLLAAILIAGCDDNQSKDRQARQSPTPSKATGKVASPAAYGVPGGTFRTSQIPGCRDQLSSEDRSKVGDFAAPGNVPEYKVLVLRRDGKPTGVDCVRAGDFLVDTNAKGKKEYALIAGDIKARYARLDAITVEFSDLKERGLRYNGGALIFNTVRGAVHLGYERGQLPSNGFVVSAGQPPSPYPERFHPTGPRGLSSGGG